MSEIITYSFCDNYIERLAGYIEEKFISPGKDLSRVAVCFGGKRPALFLKRELSRKIGKAFYPPVFFTIDDFVSYVVRKKEAFTTIQDLDNCYLLYQITAQVAPHILEGRAAFAQFLPWTREILKFIDNLDLENIPNDRLKGIEANAQIGYAVPDDINELLKAVVLIREAYHQALRQNKQYSRGLQYLRAAQVITKVDWEEFDQVLFCNFFYFNQAEEKMIKALYQQGKATLIFQGDQRKWPVLDRIAKNFSCSLVEGDAPQETTFALNLYSGFDGHSQIGLARKILKNIDALEETVIVLPNAEPIVGLMSEISSELKDFNISMGYPLQRSSLSSLFSFVFKAQLSRRKQMYYARDYLQVLKHPFIKNLRMGKSATVARILIHKIEEVLTGKEMAEISGSIFIDLDQVARTGRIFDLALETLKHLQEPVTRKDLAELLAVIHEEIFEAWEGIDTFNKFAGVLDGFLRLLLAESSLSRYQLNVSIADKIFAIKEEFQQAAFCDEAFPLEEIFKVFDAKISREIVKFQGSPLKGLQILGLMETRSLNFANVIVLDVNEGVLPRLNIYEPLIPREVMISLNLDRLEMEEEIQRYQFMRLISSARNVHLVYQESKDKERSRFIEELIWEEQKKQKHYHTAPVLKGSFQVKVASPQRVIEKTSAMVAALKKHSFSASSVNMYVRNPVDFYYSYVLGLRETEDLLDEPEARRVGTFVHELLEEVFRRFVNKKPEITPAFRQYVKEAFESKFAVTFGKGMKSDAFLLKSVLAERISRFLDHEAENPQRDVAELLHLEKRFNDVIPLSCGDISFSYIVDRIDRLTDGTIMIIDYKTGGIGQMPKAVDRIAAMPLSRENIKEEVKSFQIPLYFYFLREQYPGQKINAALYNLRTIKLEKFLDSRTAFSLDDMDKAFLRPLDFIMSEILDPEIGFVEDKNE